MFRFLTWTFATYQIARKTLRADFHPFSRNVVYDWLHQKYCLHFSLWVRTSKVSENQARRTVRAHRRIRVRTYEQGGIYLLYIRSTLIALVTSLGCDIRTKLNLPTRYSTTSEAHVKRPRAHAQESDISLVSVDQDDNFQCLSFK